jgi:hypothetical protein
MDNGYPFLLRSEGASDDPLTLYEGATALMKGNRMAFPSVVGDRDNDILDPR